MAQRKFDPYADIITPMAIKAEIGKHTPGPWKILREDWTIRSNEIKNSTQMADYQGSIICSLMEAHSNREHALAEAEANARLIASAPDMEQKIEWLEKVNADLLEALKVLSDWPLGKKNASEALCAARRYAREAISKAEGR